jgi:UV excision repair protein RAD23
VTSSSSEKKTEEKKAEIKKNDKTPENNKTEEKKYTEQVKSLIDMGFEKSQAESAIKAAKGQIDKAIDFLYNGIPTGIKDNDLEQGGEQPSQGQAQGQQQGGGDNQEEADDDPVKTVASVAKVLCKNDPSSLTLLLQHIQQSDPDLMNLIKQREEEFKNFLEEPINENDYRVLQSYQQRMGLGGFGVRQGSGSGQRQVRLNLTPQDREAIERLKALGDFNEAEVIQAYIACDKNEELTANYLFEQKMRDDANGNGQ